MTKPARLWDTPGDFQRLGLKPESVEAWEDGLRTTGVKGEYEWWYFDARFSDGSSLVMVFYTTPFANSKGRFSPYCTIHLIRPDGTELKDKYTPDPSRCSFSREGCGIQVGGCSAQGNLKRYTIRYRSEKVQAELTLESRVPPWRPATGHFYFNEQEYFAWLPAVPEGHATATIASGGQTKSFTGTGYHDHNWGSTTMWNLMHHWYWGRCKVGDYQIITSFITAGKAYGHVHFPIFLLAKNGQILSSQNPAVTYHQSQPSFDKETGKHYFQVLTYDCREENLHFRITYRAETIIERKMLVKKPLLRPVFRLRGIDPTYDRFTGTVTLERLDNGKTVQTCSAPALWELMYFGTDADV